MRKNSSKKDVAWYYFIEGFLTLYVAILTVVTDQWYVFRRSPKKLQG